MVRRVDHFSNAVKSQLSLAAHTHELFAFGLRAALREGYHRADLKADLIAGVIVGVVAIPLSMAFAIALGVAPQHGLYAAIVTGLVTALTGGSRVQITGPTAALIVVMLPIVHQYGLRGLLVTNVLASLILVAMGIGRLGRIMQFIPHPVTTGFSVGTAVVITLLQIKDVLGLTLTPSPGTMEYVSTLVANLPDANWQDFGVFAITVLTILISERLAKRLPSPLVAMLAVTAVVALLEFEVPTLHITTIGSKFHAKVLGHIVPGIPPIPPLPDFGWASLLSYTLVKQLLPSAFAIALLTGIVSLMSATVMDGITGKEHEPNAELIGLGLGNLTGAIFGGIPATGAIARSVSNARAGARSPLAAVFQSAFLLLCVTLLAPLVAHIPMATMAGILIVVALRMIDGRHLARMFRAAPTSDLTVMLICFGLTVLIDMATAVSVGVVLSSLLFMRRMAALTKVITPAQVSTDFAVPPGIKLYEIHGPIFFWRRQIGVCHAHQSARRYSFHRAQPFRCPHHGCHGSRCAGIGTGTLTAGPKARGAGGPATRGSAFSRRCWRCTNTGHPRVCPRC